jgi:hypothetical protein
MKITYETLYDEYSCDDCGYSSAVGAIIWFDGNQVFCQYPVAHCYSGETLRNKNGQECTVSEKIIELLGHELEEIDNTNT